MLDTNAMVRRQYEALQKPLEQVNRKAGQTLLRLVVPWLVSAESVFRHRRTYGHGYDVDLIRESMDAFVNGGGELEPFEALAATRYARELWRAYPDDSAWRSARRQARADRGETGRWGTHVDWFIASHAADPDRVLLSDDSGHELAWVQRIRVADLRSALAAFLDA
ncbi:MAG: hypothetical protein H6736_02545 [Alphaproteobacteria bacterium]|nr:hypothetical protein [Alphaproteobacteria bacterium]MCB9690671.1 hypothetical protein [Alphaproteobacteria bacterium]